MKGTVFQKPFEFNLRVDGESWAQGDPINGSLVIKNHGGEPVSLDAIRVMLAYADLKHVRQKSPDAFEVLQTASTPSSQLAAGNELTVPWKFETTRNSPITDTSSSLFLVYGAGSALEKMGQLQLTVTPYPVIFDFINIFQTSFRFALKSQKFNKNAVEIKLLPPDGGKAFTHVEHLILRFSFQGEELEVDYGFKVKKLEATASNFAVSKQTRSSSQVYRPDQYRTSSGRFNHDEMEGRVREVLSPFESK